MFRIKKGQAMLDYIFLLTIVVAILLIMGYYIRNTLSGRFREGSDAFGRGETYVPNVAGVSNPTVVTDTATNSIP